MERMGAVEVSASGVLRFTLPASSAGAGVPNLDWNLRRHFTSLHLEKEHQKRMAHFNTLGPGRKKRSESAAEVAGRKSGRTRKSPPGLVQPKQGYGLMPELRRAGVHVRLVPQNPQAADDPIRTRTWHTALKSGARMLPLSASSQMIEGTPRLSGNAKTRSTESSVCGSGECA